MQQFCRLEDIAWAANVMRITRLDTLPKGKRVRKLVLFLDLSGTCGSGDTMAAGELPLAITMIRLGNWVNIPGIEQYKLMHAYKGRHCQASAAMGAGVTTWASFCAIEIPFTDQRQGSADDGSLCTDLLLSIPLEVQFGAATPFADNGITITAGTVYVSAEIVDETNIPQINRISYIDGSGNTVYLDPGIYKELLIAEAGHCTITEAEITTADLELDGAIHQNNIRHEQLVAHWNLEMCSDTADELVDNAALYLPIVYTNRRHGQLTKQPACEKSGKVFITAGTLTTPRAIYWKTVFKSDDAIKQIAQRIGVPEGATTYEPAVKSKSPIRPLEESATRGSFTKKARLMYAALPGKFRKE